VIVKDMSEVKQALLCSELEKVQVWTKRISCANSVLLFRQEVII